MPALFHHNPAVEYHQSIGAPQSTQAMGNRDRCPAPNQVLKRLLNFNLGRGVDR